MEERGEKGEVLAALADGKVHLGLGIICEGQSVERGVKRSLKRVELSLGSEGITRFSKLERMDQ